MKSVKVLSIIGIILFAFSFVCGVAFEYSDPISSIGWGFISDFFGFGFAITALVVANKELKN